MEYVERFTTHKLITAHVVLVGRLEEEKLFAVSLQNVKLS